jgi:uncharacterized protein YdeI (YjbR/CyaY-like superfamily)
MRTESEDSGPMRKQVEAKLQGKDPGIAVPDDLNTLLAKHKAAETVFTKLAYSHKKEFLDWITSAKKPETRAKRLQKMVEMLEGRSRRSGNESGEVARR